MDFNYADGASTQKTAREVSEESCIETKNITWSHVRGSAFIAGRVNQSVDKKGG
jgi:hypothetical protein